MRGGGARLSVATDGRSVILDSTRPETEAEETRELGDRAERSGVNRRRDGQGKAALTNGQKGALTETSGDLKQGKAPLRPTRLSDSERPDRTERLQPRVNLGWS
jgi:hypothetical protein